MKKDIHPIYHEDVKVTCACGNSFVTGSTVKSIQIEVCSACHPFFTGKSKLLDAAGRVDKFKERLKKTELRRASLKVKKIKSSEPAGSLVPVKDNKNEETQDEK